MMEKHTCQIANIFTENHTTPRLQILLHLKKQKKLPNYHLTNVHDVCKVSIEISLPILL